METEMETQPREGNEGSALKGTPAFPGWGWRTGPHMHLRVRAYPVFLLGANSFPAVAGWPLHPASHILSLLRLYCSQHPGRPGHDSELCLSANSISADPGSYKKVPQGSTMYSWVLTEMRISKYIFRGCGKMKARNSLAHKSTLFSLSYNPSSRTTRIMVLPQAP